MPRAHTPARAVALGLALVVVGLLLSTWWALRETPGAVPADAPLALPRAPDGADPAWPAAARPALQPLRPTAEMHTPAELLLADWGGAELAVGLTGHVVGPSGRPLSGARVTAVPSGETFARRLGEVPWRSDLPIERLPAGVTDAEGAFRIDLPHVPGPGGQIWPRVPELVVSAPGLGLRAVPCAGFDGTAFDAGVIRLDAGAALTGRVVDASGRALADLDVRLRVRNLRAFADGGDYEGTIESFLRPVTGPDGRFGVDNLPPCDAGYLVVAEGLVPASVYGIEVQAGKRVDLGEVVLHQGASVLGRVTDADGQPVAGAVVSGSERDLRRAFSGLDDFGDTMPFELNELGDAVPQVVSDASGWFVLSGVQDVPLTLYVVAEHFEPGKRTDVRPGPDPLALVLQRPARLVVQVVDAIEDRPLATARVEARRRTILEDAVYNPVLPVESEAPGRFVVEGVGPGRNELVVSAPGYGERVFDVQGVPAPGRIEHSAPLEREAIVVGHCVDAEGLPRADVPVVLAPLSRPDAPPRRRALSDASGRFRLDGLVAGSWSLRVGLDERVPGVIPFTRPVGPLASGEVLDLGDLELLPAGSVRGRVVDHLEAPVPGLEIELVSRDAALVLHTSETASDVAGAFGFTELPPGPYRLRAEPGGEVEFTVAAGEERDVALRLRQPPRLQGRLTSGAQLVEGARIFVREDGIGNLWGRALRRRTTSSDASGRWQLDLVTAGQHHVTITSPRGVQLTRRVQLDWGETVLLDVAFGTCSLSGKVTDALTGLPVREASLKIAGTDGQASALLRTDATGRFQCVQLPAGGYLVEARAEGFVSTSLGPIALAPAREREDLELRLEPGASVQGQVRPGEGTTEATEVFLTLEQGEGGPADVSMAEVPGSFRFDGLPPGAYTLLVSEVVATSRGYEPGRVLRELHFELAAREERVLELRLPAEP